ncbi:MAG TPA: hypothetical protein PLD59_14080 [Tepidisphaeraceae bacterium]|nr:hypothetical protein [Tepidisphaeraceae bacterium]
MPREPNKPEQREQAPRGSAVRPAMPGHRILVSKPISAFRRTLIPMLITLAVLLPSLAIWLQRVDIDSPFNQLPKCSAPAFIGGGVVAAVLAAMNMAAAARSGRKR